MDKSDYLKSANGIFARATEGKYLQYLALKKLQEMTRVMFTTANVGVTDGRYVVALNIPWWAVFSMWKGKREREGIVLEWIKSIDPEAQSVKIVRTAKHLAKERVVLP
jgi:hypothetical protein